MIQARLRRTNSEILHGGLKDSNPGRPSLIKQMNHKSKTRVSIASYNLPNAVPRSLPIVVNQPTQTALKLTMQTTQLSSSFFATPSGARLHFIRTESVSGPFLICLHGLGGSTETFTPLLPHLPQSFNIVLVDFPGFGKTVLSDQAKRISIAQHVDDIHHLVTSLQTSQAKGQSSEVTIIGHSLGAAVATHYASRNPDQIAGLVLISPIRAISHIPVVRRRMLDLAANTREKGIEFAADLATKTNFYEEQSQKEPDYLAKETIRSLVAASDPEAYAQTCEAIASPDHVDPNYEVIKCPVVFVAGDKDMISPVERSEGLSRLFGGNTKVKTVSSGHQPILEAPGEVGLAVNELLGQIL